MDGNGVKDTTLEGCLEGFEELAEAAEKVVWKCMNDSKVSVDRLEEELDMSFGNLMYMLCLLESSGILTADTIEWEGGDYSEVHMMISITDKGKAVVGGAA